MVTTTSFSPELSAILDYAIGRGASDIHLAANASPCIRVDGDLQPLDMQAYTGAEVDHIIGAFIGNDMYARISRDRKEIDFSFSYKQLRFRANVYFERGSLSLSLRLLPTLAADLSQLGLPAITSKLLDHSQGLVIICGPTGHGKSTTLAADGEPLIAERRSHLITIEDPIEYLFEHKKGLVSQREVGVDTPSFGSALRAALREDPDIVLLGEMRDQETIEAALQMAETGHLVLTTLHTNSASQAPDRIIDAFPVHQQSQVRAQIADVLIGVVAQRLLPKVQGGRVMASEVMVANSAIRALIREGKTHQLPNIIQTSASEGMIGLDKSLAELVSRVEVSIDTALAWSLDPKALKMMIY